MLLQTFETEFDTTAVDTGVGFGVLAFQLVLAVLWLGFQIWMIRKIASYDEGQYTAAGQNRSLWIGLGVLGVCCFGVIIDILWFVLIKPKLEQPAAGSFGGGGGFPPPAPPAPPTGFS